MAPVLKPLSPLGWDFVYRVWTHIKPENNCKFYKDALGDALFNDKIFEFDSAYKKVNKSGDTVWAVGDFHIGGPSDGHIHLWSGHWDNRWFFEGRPEDGPFHEGAHRSYYLFSDLGTDNVDDDPDGLFASCYSHTSLTVGDANGLQQLRTKACKRRPVAMNNAVLVFVAVLASVGPVRQVYAQASETNTVAHAQGNQIVAVQVATAQYIRSHELSETDIVSFDPSAVGKREIVPDPSAVYAIRSGLGGMDRVRLCDAPSASCRLGAVKAEYHFTRTVVNGDSAVVYVTRLRKPKTRAVLSDHAYYLQRTGGLWVVTRAVLRRIT